MASSSAYSCSPFVLQSSSRVSQSLSILSTSVLCLPTHAHNSLRPLGQGRERVTTQHGAQTHSWESKEPKRAQPSGATGKRPRSLGRRFRVRVSVSVCAGLACLSGGATRVEWGGKLARERERGGGGRFQRRPKAMRRACYSAGAALWGPPESV